MRNTHSSVDLVYTWCDAADAVWNSKRISTAEACGLVIIELMRSQNEVVER